MHIPAVTEERLKAYLDSNQVSRERLCQSILALDGQYSAVVPRHPKGGPDKGRDLEARHRSGEIAYGAVAFVNGANDSAPQKRTIKKKFATDLASAIGSKSDLGVFAFFTNVALTLGEKSELTAQAYAKGIVICDIFDRERIRVALDNTDGFAVRLQYLGLPLSEAEQTSFFSRWGDQIQSVIANRFERIEGSLDRLLFLQEANEVLSTLTVRYILDRPYAASEIGHFRAFCSVYLKAVRLGIFGIQFGSADRYSRFYRLDTDDYLTDPPGFQHGLSGGSWENIWSVAEVEESVSEGSDEELDEPEKWTPAGSSTSRAYDPVQIIAIQYDHDEWIRVRDRLQLRDLNMAKLIFEVDANLAGKIETIEVFANGYSLAVYERDALRIVEGTRSPPMVHRFTSEELATPWKKLEAKEGWSFFELDFDNSTPRRTFEAQKVAARTKAVSREGRPLATPRSR